jgi:ACS family hexuronate transporter-like MFS transporter
MSTPGLARASAPRFRWVVCGLLFLATANNYIDRQALGVLAPELIAELGWTAGDYAKIVFWFQVGFAIGFPLTGRFLDAVGTRWGFAIAVAVWSLVSAAHGLISSVAAFKVARFALGLSQPSNMPAGVKVVGEWFLPAERALATGVFKAGANLGSIVVPLAVPALFFVVGWRLTLVLLASTGFVWLVFWLWLYRSPTGESAAEPMPVGGRVRWRVLLTRREVWAYMNFKFLTDAVWHWYVAMLPLFLAQRFGLSLREFGLPLVAVYAIASLGSVGGGWISSWWMRRGWSLTRARKVAMFVCCASTLPVLLVTQVEGLWACIGLIGLAMAAHQGLTSNLFTVVTDQFPTAAVGTVVGLGGTAAQLGAALMTLLTGAVLADGGHLTEMFLVAGAVYLVAFLIFHVLVPRIEPLELPMFRSEPADAP